MYVNQAYKSISTRIMLYCCISVIRTRNEERNSFRVRNYMDWKDKPIENNKGNVEKDFPEFVWLLFSQVLEDAGDRVVRVHAAAPFMMRISFQSRPLGAGNRLTFQSAAVARIARASPASRPAVSPSVATVSKPGLSGSVGVKALDSGREALRPDELRQAIVEGVTPEGLMVGPSAQTFRMKQAARADIDRQVGTKANDVVALKNVLKGEGDWNRDRIGMLFGQERADKALSLLDREARFANTNNDVTGNSFTAARSAAQKELFPSDASSFGVREAFAAGGVRGAARNLGTRGLDRLVGVLADSGVDARNAGLGEALAGNKQAIINALDQLQSSKDISPQMQRLIQAMMLERGIKAGESAQGLLTRF
ncbi:hypothetical protein BR10RB9215_C12098 [Brucella sp. 10RB9215]|nr:hypothetical protein BR10RB9215_C12098 [Brucella sp. 10RB9215]